MKGLDSAFTLLKSIRKGDNEGPIGSQLLLAVSGLEGMTEAKQSLTSMASYVEKKFMNEQQSKQA